MMNLTALKDYSVNFVRNNQSICAAVAGYGLTSAYTVLNPVGGAIFLGTFTAFDGLKSREISSYRERMYMESKSAFLLKKIKPLIIASVATSYLTQFANMVTAKSACLFVASIPGKIFGGIVAVAAKAFTMLAALPAKIVSSTAYVISGTNLPAVALTVVALAVVYFAYNTYKYVEAKNQYQEAFAGLFSDKDLQTESSPKVVELTL